MPEHKIVKQGISHVPEGRRMFSNLTVLENLKMGAYTRKDKQEINHSLEMVYERFSRLKERTRQLAGTLSGGEQQMLAMGRALMANPRILLLDEPSMGLSPLLVSEIFDIIQEINKQGVTILLVEQNAKKALSIANRAYVLETGRIVKEDDAQALLHDEAIKKAYLGEEGGNNYVKHSNYHRPSVRQRRTYRRQNAGKASGHSLLRQGDYFARFRRKRHSSHSVSG